MMRPQPPVPPGILWPITSMGQDTLILMLVAYIAGMITAMILLAPRGRR